MDECLEYFRRAIATPALVPPWSQWWAVNAELTAQVFPLADFVRLKHRRLRGARQILQRSGELPAGYQPPSALVTGSCADCGERVAPPAPNSASSVASCPHCGSAFARLGSGE